ncbi:hypothetical protein N0V82_006486 [Gnomoniopsis sp. IMI 355080]|nr:hypothetical protein N0V82_006486 [Gnomoniopsis sp. IMI 355080]
MQLIPSLTAALLAAGAAAHPGEEAHHINRAAELSRREFRAAARRGLDSCASKLQARGGLVEAAAKRRADKAAYYRERALAARAAKGDRKRDTDSVLATDHNATDTLGYTVDTPESTIFATNTTCILTPEGETGPYWVKGELIRESLQEDQEGVPVTLEAQFLDVETCEPLTDLYWDVWNCNATGVYSGLVATGNGNTDDLSNYNTTFLRGIGKADDDGVVTFETLVPGHYSGRTNHVHMIAHLNPTVLPNNTLTGGTVPHVGQLFYDQDLVDAVEATYPYNTNTIDQTTNAEDRVFGIETEDDGTDPVLEYVYLTDDLTDGLFGWITIAVNTSASYDPAYSYAYTASGGVVESGGDDSSY